MNSIANSIQQLFTKKVNKKNELFSIFNNYVNAVNKINSLKNREKLLEIQKIKNQIEEYYIPLSEIQEFVNLDNVNEDKLINKVKHISEIKPELFNFAEIYATPTENGIILSTEKKPPFESELLRIVSYKKVK